MATAMMRTDEIKLETNVPVVFALKFSTGKPVGQWGNIMFTAIDSRRLFLNSEDANEFEHALVDLRIEPAEFIRVTRVKHGKQQGGGFSIRVERVPDTTDPAPARMPPSREESLLEKSVEMARTDGPAAFITPRDPEPVKAPVEKKDGVQTAASDYLQQFNGSAVAPKYKAAYAVAIEILIEAKRLALTQGLAFDVRCEDVRCLAATIIIDGQGGRR